MCFLRWRDWQTFISLPSSQITLLAGTSGYYTLCVLLESQFWLSNSRNNELITLAPDIVLWLQQIMVLLKDDDPSIQLDGLHQLNEILSVAMEDALSMAPVESLVPLLVRLLSRLAHMRVVTPGTSVLTSVNANCFSFCGSPTTEMQAADYVIEQSCQHWDLVDLLRKQCNEIFWPPWYMPSLCERTQFI